jgi:acyl dehydratase
LISPTVTAAKTGHFILGSDLEPISFDDLPLGGEWTTRRRTISEAEIALFGALAGDFAPLTIDVSHAGARFAPPALLVAVAIGLGTMDMPIPSVAEWEWVNWKFPRPVKAGETIYARWTLTQKRPPVGGAPTAIVVWRVDVHTVDGALCAEGEVGASVRRKAQAKRPRSAESAPAPPAPRPAPASRRRRGRRPAASTAPAPALPPPVEAVSVVAAAPPGTAEKTGAARRRRRRRPRSSSAPVRDGQAPTAAQAEVAAPPPVSIAASASAAAPTAGRLSRVIKRLRRP